MYIPTPVIAEMIGKQFGRLTILRYAEHHGQVPFMSCRCSCGNRFIASVYHIRYGRTRSCGCFRVDVTTTRLTKHGFAPLRGKRKRIYCIWQGMNARCNNPRFIHYKYYGGRGISVCKRWRGKSGFVHFLQDMGEPEKGMSIERQDPNGNYCPSNCIWIPRREQASNQNSNWKVILNGEKVTAAEADRRFGKGRNYFSQMFRLDGRDKRKPVHL